MTLRPVRNDLQPRRRRYAAVVIALLGVLFCRTPAPAATADRPGEATSVGALIRITQPITGQTPGRVRRFVRRALDRARQKNKRPVLIFEFETRPGQEEYSLGSEFGAAVNLAQYLTSGELSEATTVAYVPRAVRGHAVLAALACDQLMMPGDAELGPVGIEPRAIGDTERSAYREIAGRRKTVPTEVALWLLDPSRDVLKVETERGSEYVTPEGLAELRKRRTVKSQQPLRDLIAGSPGQLGGDEARRLDFSAYKPRSRQDVAKTLKLPPEVMHEDPSLVGEVRAVLVPLTGAVDAATVTQIERMIREKIDQHDANFIILRIDSPGGSPEDSLRLAGFLAELDPHDARTVAYIPEKALSDAALVALACDQVVMYPRAKLGGSGAYELSPEEVKYVREAIQDPNGPWKTRSWSLVAAIIDPDLEVFHYEGPGEEEYFCDEQFEQFQQQHPEAGKWHKDQQQVTRTDRQFSARGQQAVEYRLANRTVENFDEFKQHYGLEGDPALVEPGWADFLIEALASPPVAGTLLTIAFVALYIELSMPGIGIGGFAATVCLLLYFWSQPLGGSAGWLVITLFVTGIGCLLMEVFVLPGFGIFGLGGGLLVLVSLVLASQTVLQFPPNPYQFAQLRRSLLTIAGAGVGVIVVIVMLRRWLPGATIFNRLFLRPPEGEEAEKISRNEALVDLNHFVGVRGTTTTQLTPSGKARFGNDLLDVITDGDVVGRGARIEIVEVHGNRVIVKVVDSG